MGCCSSCCCESTDGDEERRPLLGPDQTTSSPTTSTVVSSQPRRSTEDDGGSFSGTERTHRIDYVSETTHTSAEQLGSAAVPHSSEHAECGGDGKPMAENGQPTGEQEVPAADSTEISDRDQSVAELLVDIQEIPENRHREIIQTGPGFQTEDETAARPSLSDSAHIPADTRFATEENASMPAENERRVEDGITRLPLNTSEETTEQVPCVTPEYVAVLGAAAGERELLDEVNEEPHSSEVKDDKDQVEEAVNKLGDVGETTELQQEELVDEPKTEGEETHSPKHLSLGLTWSVDRTEIFGDKDIITVEQDECIKSEMQRRPRNMSLKDELEAVEKDAQESVKLLEQKAAAGHEVIEQLVEELREHEVRKDTKPGEHIPEQKRTEPEISESETSNLPQASDQQADCKASQIAKQEAIDEATSTTPVDDESSEQQADVESNDTGDDDSVSAADDSGTSDMEQGEGTEKNKESQTTSRLATVELSGLTTLFHVKDGGPISGVTSLDNNLYVLRRKANYSIEVYDAVNYDFKHRLTVKDLAECSDMTSCSQNHCLYIAANVDMIYILTPGKGETTSWSARDELAGISLIAVSHNLLATCFKINKLKEFMPDGQLVKDVSLSPAIEHPLHAVQLSTGQYVVCHGSQSHRMNRVLVVNEDGSLIKKFGGRRRSSVMSPSPMALADQSGLSVPCHVAVSDDNMILVADSNNCRLLVLNAELDKVSEHNCVINIEPVRLSLDSETKRLYIAVNYSTDDNKYIAGQVAVVQFQP